MSLWNHPKAKEVDVKQLSFTKPRKGNTDEPFHGVNLPKLYDLPPDPETPKGAGAFADYPRFLDIYKSFAKAYISCGQQDRPGQPLYLETDKFLNFLYHEDDDVPSLEYKDKPHRDLTDSKRAKEIQKYRERRRQKGFSQGGDNSEPARLVQKYLDKNKVMQLTESEVLEVANKLNSLHSLPWVPAKFLKSNDLDKIKRAWHDLIHGSGELIHDPGNLKLRMNKCNSALRVFGKASIQEMLGYYYPDRYPLRNANTNAGLRFLGYNV